MTHTPEAIRNLKEQCVTYKTRTELMRGNPALYQRVKRAGLDHICFAHMPIQRRWDDEALAREAGKYSTRTEMLVHDAGLYVAIRRRGLHHILPPSLKGQH